MWPLPYLLVCLSSACPDMVPGVCPGCTLHCAFTLPASWVYGWSLCELCYTYPTYHSNIISLSLFSGTCIIRWIDCICRCIHLRPIHYITIILVYVIQIVLFLWIHFVTLRHSCVHFLATLPALKIVFVTYTTTYICLYCPFVCWTCVTEFGAFDVGTCCHYYHCNSHPATGRLLTYFFTHMVEYWNWFILLPVVGYGGCVLLHWRSFPAEICAILYDYWYYSLPFPGVQYAYNCYTLIETGIHYCILFRLCYYLQAGAWQVSYSIAHSINSISCLSLSGEWWQLVVRPGYTQTWRGGGEPVVFWLHSILPGADIRLGITIVGERWWWVILPVQLDEWWTDNLNGSDRTLRPRPRRHCAIDTFLQFRTFLMRIDILIRVFVCICIVLCTAVLPCWIAVTMTNAAFGWLGGGVIGNTFAANYKQTRVNLFCVPSLLG